VRSALNGRRRYEPLPPREVLLSSPVARGEAHARVREWAQIVAAGLDDLKLSPEVVEAIWRPQLVKLGVVKAGGRKPNEQRCRLVERLMKAAPRKIDGDLADGFWRAAHAAVVKAEGEKAPATIEALRAWWLDHRVACPRPRGSHAT
jgi:hypothetical protein